VLKGRSECDALSIHRDQLFAIAQENDRLDSELEVAAEELERANAKFRRIQRQKKIWRERMSVAISRGLKSVEALEDLERREEEEKRSSETATTAASTSAEPSAGKSCSSFLSFDTSRYGLNP
jgi:DNA repair exonuclease SbcCD ATPase subunit